MPRDPSARENRLKAKARRDNALARMDLRQPTTPRTSAAGPTSHSIKVPDPEAARAIEAFLAKREAGQ